MRRDPWKNKVIFQWNRLIFRTGFLKIWCRKCVRLIKSPLYFRIYNDIYMFFLYISDYINIKIPSRVTEIRIDLPHRIHNFYHIFISLFNLKNHGFGLFQTDFSPAFFQQRSPGLSQRWAKSSIWCASLSPWRNWNSDTPHCRLRHFRTTGAAGF